MKRFIRILPMLADQPKCGFPSKALQFGTISEMWSMTAILLQMNTEIANTNGWQVRLPEMTKTPKWPITKNILEQLAPRHFNNKWSLRRWYAKYPEKWA